MSDKMRWRYGETRPVPAAVDTDTVIEIGDLVFQVDGRVKPASEASLSDTFAPKFLGVAMQRSREGDNKPIRVATDGVFVFECDPTYAELGDLVAVAEDGTATPYNQRVEKTTEESLAIGRVARREAFSSQELLIEIRSAVMGR